ncbi:hypothetical protein A0256_00285 [Mucilaginibacter sp. PAMC 26640]|nr:hypothetical protein A0256_00285 [Mucilaginibacter sp. PAMC 26640]
MLDCWFFLYRNAPKAPVVLHHYDTAIYQQGTMNISYRAFDADVSKEMACQVLAKQLAQQLPSSMAVPCTVNNESAMAC